MDVVELLPRLHLLRFPVGQAYLWRDGDDDLTLIDAGPVGSGGALAEAITSLGLAPGAVRRIVLTHFHEDHAGGAGEWGEVPVLAHRLDAPYVRQERPGPPPVLQDWERPLHAEVTRGLPPLSEATPPPVAHAVSDGDVLDFGGGARVVHVPGHTDGSIALHLPAHGVLFTGDTIAASPVDGTVMPGVFNLDRERALASLRQLAGLETEVACFGHGDAVTAGAGAVLREVADRPA
ncbi:MBL fold metallo-hydrolase [Streptomyces sp. NPDC028635]|uniref:MBL fold metallo-hydrolase n=1 Tax=Streptomyces sp. NPDC028635 TaxID=3154800 RepID=UPI0033CC5A06